MHGSCATKPKEARMNWTRDLAKLKGISVPTSVVGEDEARLDRLTEIQGGKFDTVFVKALVALVHTVSPNYVDL
jgi:hypothetical protein